ncbi:winged helix DNA-binding domain-containing protein [Nocardia cyriacigeorgica]|uniref:Winged helix DNA-binding domain-containing protein n=1 Tax=Nocardia cyriacigeorgica TaxID=135487 RepID=A0A6P1D5P8_9NOCA|nr:winged helix DNA-binding domain-containing protein [Nocardia cyriacigeorgica]NEW41471.1 winged helix DNA-binding domain-containing protein [Nocardia cyriacigeorgica]NEW45757.1 winged helix DNA-binding domain-containing protein [Nocardia cyriacigeorgica]NEW51983.1 winged helix DNA-binding domain-containing protein [Nocardia cyriacigeorgica]NEW55776.1 winged helix DNA-binding domain-containing protein [Nocardia cyriacigeorgica]
MRSIDTAQRRARLGVRHRLVWQARTGNVADIARSLVVLHATDPATVFLSVAARGDGIAPGDIEQALYEDRSLLRMLAMRRTMFVAPVELVPVLQASCADALADKQRRTYGKYLEQAGIGDGDVPSWLAAVEDETHRALLARGAATGAQLSKDVPLLRTQVNPTPDKAYARPTNITTWVLVTLGAEGRIVRGRPNGSWSSSQYSWAPTESWLPDGVVSIPADAARDELVRQWLRAFGPAPVSDIKWWTGWTLGEVRKTLARLDVTEVELDDGTGVVLTDDLDPVEEPEPWAALLPALDPTPMGWQSRAWYLGDHASALFDRNGNIGPTIWWNGRIVGGWAQRKDGEIALRLLEDVGSDAVTMIDAEAERIGAWYGEVRPIPRFRTPLERELTA